VIRQRAQTGHTPVYRGHRMAAFGEKCRVAPRSAGQVEYRSGYQIGKTKDPG